MIADSSKTDSSCCEAQLMTVALLVFEQRHLRLVVSKGRSFLTSSSPKKQLMRWTAMVIYRLSKQIFLIQLLKKRTGSS